MNDQPMTAAGHLHQAAAELQRDEHGNFKGTWRSPSQARAVRDQLSREQRIIWLLPEHEVRSLPWARERFGRPSPHRRGLVAKSIDARGRTVRFWSACEEDQIAYQRLLTMGAGTCPLEAIWPPSILVGQPSQPAHPHILPRLWAAIAAADGELVALPLEPAPNPLLMKEIERAFWAGLRPEPEVASHG